jgi:hypothetical protein
MTQVDKRELFAHHNIHFETHREVYERSSSSGLGGVASKSPFLDPYFKIQTNPI